ncbi:hypothetical protein H1W00_07205 [Aeromicrobium sp. Marseille-Q0843]|uniref:Uncharacterized protein n=1 Tax=Aeromicrobium phoceense TaxID=2754045 RepID=A0A838XH31_9ACTN|nr:hypothetical protein [Aeromicrobium phoceense]MBA4608261.1 hypothetical protein [Aeromicrobium phoceense]
MPTVSWRWSIALAALALVAVIAATIDYWETLPYGSRWLPYGSNVQGRSLGVATACCLIGTFVAPRRRQWFKVCAVVAGVLFYTSSFHTGAGQANEFPGVILPYFLLPPLILLITATLVRVALDASRRPEQLAHSE